MKMTEKKSESGSNDRLNENKKQNKREKTKQKNQLQREKKNAMYERILKSNKSNESNRTGIVYKLCMLDTEHYSHFAYTHYVTWCLQRVPSFILLCFQMG